MKGFFQASELPTRAMPLTLIPECGVCGLWKTCQSPKMEPTGKGKRKILIVGEAPGATEDRQGKQFVGDSGQLLQRTLVKYGIDFRRDCWIDNAARCRPPRNKLPDKAIEYCRPNLIKTVQELNPEIIILLGKSPTESLLGWVWKEEVGAIGRWLGWQIPSQKLNAWICPTWHPSYILRTEYGVSQKENEVRTLLFEQHLEAAVKLQGRPWKKVPDYESKLRLCTDCNEAAKLIRQLTKGDRPLAWDLETDRLKPDHPESRIICCSVSDGRISVAYPWHGVAIEATKEMLYSPVPKIGFNAKFEERWMLRLFGKPVCNWVWDGMLAAHVLDNRKQICSLKFQAFVLLGVDAYDMGVKPYMKTKGSNVANRLKEMDLQQLLKYCALDSLYEWKVAMKQSKQIGIDLMEDNDA